jgi:hypothetical protein
MASRDRFLNSRSRIEPYAALGRVFSVVRETWQLKDDPKKTPPKTELLTAQRSASDAADVARDAAAALPQHGFHKPSGAWWGSDGQDFHRFLITSRGDRGLATMVLPIALGIAATIMMRGSRRPVPRQPKEKPKRSPKAGAN